MILNLFISFLNPLSICNFYCYAALFVFFSFQNASPDVCKVLVGNKIDCDDERVIDTDKGKSVGLVFFLLLNRSIKEQFWSHKLFKAIHLEAYIFLQVYPRHGFMFLLYSSAATLFGMSLFKIEMLNSDNCDEIGRSCMYV